MKIITVPTQGAFSANCYIVVSGMGNAVMIDCPCGSERLLAEVEKSGASLKKILLTHGHCDHIESLADIAEATGAEVYVHKFDAPKLTDSHLNLSDYFSAYLDEAVKKYDKAISVSDGDVITQDELEFKVMHTPGHTSGSVCFLVGDVMFSGDTIFRDSIGRTDMPDGNYTVLAKSLEDIRNLKGDYRILSGHGPDTTLSREKNRNPFLSGNMFDY